MFIYLLYLLNIQDTYLNNIHTEARLHINLILAVIVLILKKLLENSSVKNHKEKNYEPIQLNRRHRYQLRFGLSDKTTHV